MRDRTWLYIILVVGIILFIAVAMLVIRNYDNMDLHLKNTTVENPKQNITCDYTNPNKLYIKTEPNCVINFMCTNGQTAFKDSCGCGCKIS